MVGDTSTYNGSGSISNMIHKAANKTVAWINYMTNVNRTYGNFAIKDNEAFMVMNRNYELQITGGASPTKIAIGDLS